MEHLPHIHYIDSEGFVECCDMPGIHAIYENNMVYSRLPEALKSIAVQCFPNLKENKLPTVKSETITIRNEQNQILGQVFSVYSDKYKKTVWQIKDGNPKEAFETAKEATFVVQSAKALRMLDPDVVKEIRANR